MAKLHDMGTQQGEHWVAFHCPGCEGGHAIPVSGPRAWKWNDSFDKPTIKPSLLVNVGGGNPTQPICHSFITDGKIQFLDDCTHKLVGQTVEIPDLDEPREREGRQMRKRSVWIIGILLFAWTALTMARLTLLEHRLYETREELIKTNQRLLEHMEAENVTFKNLTDAVNHLNNATGYNTESIRILAKR